MATAPAPFPFAGRQPAVAGSTLERQVRFRLTRLGLLDLAKYGALVGVVIAILTVIGVYIGWTSFDQAGGLQGLDATISGGSSSSSFGSVTKVVNTGSVMALALVVAALQFVGSIVLAVIGGLFYNAAARLTGGLFVGFSSVRRS
jgi:hypothetical protein